MSESDSNTEKYIDSLLDLIDRLTNECNELEEKVEKLIKENEQLKKKANTPTIPDILPPKKIHPFPIDDFPVVDEDNDYWRKGTADRVKWEWYENQNKIFADKDEPKFKFYSDVRSSGKTGESFQKFIEKNILNKDWLDLDND